ncbi:MAG: metallophosphoesterase [Deinococcota bacterium]
MKLAILADIHGNIQALDAVLADVIPWQPDEIIVNGDMVNRGPNSLEVMTHLAELATTHTTHLVLGNHDDLMRKWVEQDADLPEDWFTDSFWDTTAENATRLAEAGWLETLCNLPMTHEVDLPDAPTLLISHGSPRHYREGYNRRLSDESISEILQMHPADVLIGSHTHVPMSRTWGHKRILNTGAVGAPFNRDTRAQYMRLTLLPEPDDLARTAQRWQVTFHAVDYDHAAALVAYDETGYAARGGVSADIFRRELIHARPHYASFWMWCETGGHPKDALHWQQFIDKHPERFMLPEPLEDQPIDYVDVNVDAADTRSS